MYQPQSSHRNINMLERWFSMIGGGALTTLGLRRGGLRGFLMSLAGGYLAQRGLSGHCEVYNALGINTAGDLSALHGYGGSNGSDQSRSYDTQADQAEGERSTRKKSTRVGRTPGSAEGDRETVEADLQAKSNAQGM